MNGAQIETKNSAATPNGADVDVVMGRFQNWAEMRRPKNAAPRGGEVSAANPAREIRDVSYEQALRASKYRRPSDPISLDPLLAADAAADNSPRAEPPPVRLQAAEEGRDERSIKRSPPAQQQPHPIELMAAAAPPLHIPQPLAPVMELQPEAAVEAVPSETKTAVAKADAAQPIEVKSPEAKPPAARKIAPERRNAASSGKGSAVRQAAAKSETEKLQPPEIEAAEPATTAAATETPHPANSTRRPDRSRPAFRDVLEGTAALVAASQPVAPPLERGKATVLTLRVSEAEQEQIQACAARANSSVSAYLRQCALGVDDLRQQVELALLNLRQREARSEPEPGLAAIPGILRRCGIQFFAKFRARPRSHSAISLRGSSE
jgi:hypothetical protein